MKRRPFITRIIESFLRVFNDTSCHAPETPTRTLKRRFESVANRRREVFCTYSIADALMSDYARFATKELSMLTFENLHRELHIEQPVGIDQDPSDTQMSEILDGIDIDLLDEAFADEFR